MHVCVWCTHETIVLKLKEEDEINHIIIIISSLTTLGLLFLILFWNDDLLEIAQKMIKYV